MTGQQFQAVRRFNRISQQDICDACRFLNRSSVYKLEQEDLVPERYVLILQNYTGIKLTDEKIAEEYYNKLPEKFKKPIRRPVKHFFSGCSIRYPNKSCIYNPDIGEVEVLENGTAILHVR